MPLLKRKLQKDKKKIVQQKIVVAQESPDLLYDLADCGLTQIPDGVFSYCKVLHKNTLNLRGNKLHDFKAGGVLSDLRNIKILDLSHNSFSSLPKDMSCLSSLQKLDLSFNKLTKLPEQLGDIISLRYLSVEGNRLTHFISNVRNLQHLKYINISGNEHVAHLPVDLCFLGRLETLDCDLANIRYPPPEVTTLGLKEIKRWFKLVVGDEFDSLLAEIQRKQASFMGDGSDAIEIDASLIHQSTSPDYVEQERRRDLQQKLLKSEDENKQLLEDVARERGEMANRVQMQELLDQEELSRACNQNERSRKSALDAWLQAESMSENETVCLVMQMSERARNAEAVLEELERDREHLDQLYNITWEESERLRKEDVLESMSLVLEEMQRHQNEWENCESHRSEAARLALSSCIENDDAMDRHLRNEASMRMDLTSKILSEEEAQKEAFQIMQFQQDAILSRIRAQVELVEAELLQITKQEIDRSQRDEREEMKRLNEMRTSTAMLLGKLMEEKQGRQEELMKRLGEMETQRSDEEKDYWLVQYQRLLDSKPQALKEDEFLLDPRIVDVLVQADASNYRPLFARRRVSYESILSADNDTLRDVGVANAEARKKILKTLALDSKAPSHETVGQSCSTAPAAPQMEATLERECVICMEKVPNIILLMCGHVCTCAECCQPLTECPVCRCPISQKCRLYMQ